MISQAMHTESIADQSHSQAPQLLTSLIPRAPNC